MSKNKMTCPKCKKQITIKFPIFHLGSTDPTCFSTVGIGGHDAKLTATLPDNKRIQITSVEGISYSITNDFYSGNRVEGTIIATNIAEPGLWCIQKHFDGKTTIDLPPIHILVEFVNEHGNGYNINFQNVRFTEEGSAVAIDDIVIETSYTFIAESVAYENIRPARIYKEETQ